MFLKDICDKESVNGIPITPYVNEYRARIRNTRLRPGVSGKQILHYSQLIKSRVFQQFNYYSTERNQEHYDDVRAPLIELDNIVNTTIPIAMFVGDHDAIATEDDCKRLAKQLGGQTVIEYMTVKDFNHYSFNLFHTDHEDAEEFLQRMMYWTH